MKRFLNGLVLLAVAAICVAGFSHSGLQVQRAGVSAVLGAPGQELTPWSATETGQAAMGWMDQVQAMDSKLIEDMTYKV